MLPVISFFVLARVVLSVSTNAVQKRLLLHQARISMTWIATYALMLAPACLLALARPAPPHAPFWRDVFIGGFLDAIGNLAMVAALRGTDLSIFGPLNAFRPVLALLFGWVILGELPAPTGAIGVGITVTGALFLLRDENAQASQASRGRIAQVVVLRITGLSLSTFGAVFLKRAATRGSAELTLAGWIACGLVCLLVLSLFRTRNPLPDLAIGFRKHRDWLLLHAALFLIMQWFTIRIFQETLLAYSFVFFQLGMILQVILGRALFRETSFRRRLAACAVMCAGSALILWRG